MPLSVSDLTMRWWLHCFFVATAIITVVMAEKTPSLEILPYGETVTKEVGEGLALTCKPNVEKSESITQLEWRDKHNRKIETTSPTAPLYVQKLPGEFGIVLLFRPLTENLAGEYTCFAYYANTEPLKATISVKTIVDITFVDAPESQYPVLGQDYKIRCEVQARPAPLVDWNRNGKAITSDDRYIIENDGLLIKNVKESDDGTYTCSAVVLQTGHIKIRNIKVEVQVPPTVQPMDDITVIEGEQTTAACIATGKPPPTYTWIREDTRQDLSKTDRFDAKKNTGLLFIHKAEYTDQSTYKCIAENPAGKHEMTVKINVLVKPKIYELLNITAPVKTETKIICKAYGRPPPQVLFRKRSNKEPFKFGMNTNRITLEQEVDNVQGFTFGILNIFDLNRTDDGLYECIAENEAGTAYKNGHITVEFPPTFERTKNLPPVWTWDNRPGNLSCLPEAIPNATIKWRYNNYDLNDSEQIKIYGTAQQSFLIVRPGNEKRFFTKYECVATNKLGTASHFIELRQATVPSVVQQVKFESITATTVKFNIVGPPNLHGLPLRSFTVQYQTERERLWETARNHTWSIDSPYILEDLIPEETYNFRFAAANDVGLGGWGGNLHLTMPRRSVPAEPKIYISNYKQSDDNTVMRNDLVVASPYADHFELRWNVPNDNGDPIDSYIIRFCITQKINGEWRDSEDCGPEIVQSFQYTNYELHNLQPDTTYKIELRARNAIGLSSPAQIRVKTARGLDIISYEKPPVLSSAMIIGIVVGAILLGLILIDITCFVRNRAGILALICDCARSKSEDEEDPKLGSYKAAPAHPNSLNLPLPVKLVPTPTDEKEPLQPGMRVEPTINGGEKKNLTVEYDGRHVYPKTGEIIGKHSAV